MDFKFLRHPYPFEHENLESYLYRLANENAVPIGWILSEFNIKSRRFSLSISDSTIQALSKATLLSERTIRNMTASGLSSSNYDGINLKKGSKFCPVCLKEHCYPRVHWEFTLLSICNKHNTVLISRCPNCNTMINNHMVINGVCSCGIDLTNITPTYISNHGLLDFNESLYEAHNIGTSNKIFFQDLSGVKYIEFICAFYNFIDRNKNFVHQPWIENTQVYNNSSKVSSFEILLTIINDWPNKLYSIFDDVYYYKQTENWRSTYNKPCFFNPAGDIYREFHGIIGEKEYDFFNRIVFTYFKSRFNYDIFKTKYKKFLYNQEYLSCSFAKYLFAVDLSIFKKLYIQSRTMELVNIHDIFTFYDKVINSIEISLEGEGYINLQDLNHLFVPPVIEYFKIK